MGEGAIAAIGECCYSDCLNKVEPVGLGNCRSAVHSYHTSRSSEPREGILEAHDVSLAKSRCPTTAPLYGSMALAKLLIRLWNNGRGEGLSVSTKNSGYKT